jgi:hypothetical protein
MPIFRRSIHGEYSERTDIIATQYRFMIQRNGTQGDSISNGMILRMHAINCILLSTLMTMIKLTEYDPLVLC